MVRAREYLEEIADLCDAASQEKGAQLLDKVTDLYFVTAEQHTAADREAFGEIIERMAFSADPMARARLAERIATADPAPIDLLHRLARDEIGVARPVLQYSPCLREGDLVSITSEVNQEHLVATAHRRDLTPPVTDVLVQRGEEPVLHAVIRNASAALSRGSIALLKHVAENNETLRKALRLRRDVTKNPIDRLKQFAATDFWQQVTQSLLMSEDESNDSEAPTPQDEVNDDPEENQPADIAQQPEPDKEEQPPQLQGAALEKMLVDTAKAKETEKAVAALAQIADLDEQMTSHCLFEAHISALMVLCKANRLASSAFTSLLQLRETETGQPVNDVVGLMRRYEGMTPDTAQKIMRFSQKSRANDEDENQPNSE